MKIKILVLLFIGLALTNCATTHEGPMAQSNSKDVLISIQRNSNLSDKHYLFYEYTLENKSTQWKDVQVVDVDFAGENTEVLSDDKLASWIEGAELKLKKDQYNTSIALGALTAVGGVVALTSGSRGGQTAGLGTMVASSAGSTAVGITRAHNKATTGVKGVNGTVNVPQTHVFMPSKIAPESYIKRWIVVKAPRTPPLGPEEEERKNRNFFFKQPFTSKVKIDGLETQFVSELDTTSRFAD